MQPIAKKKIQLLMKVSFTLLLIIAWASLQAN